VASLGPLLSARYPSLLPDPLALLPVDAFIVKYATAVGQVELPMHRDGALLTVNIALNSFEEYVGGGTWVESSGRSVRAALGSVICHPSSVRHAGAPISDGTRYILVAFCISDLDVEHSRRFLGDGVALAKAGRVADARTCFQRSVAEDPSNQAAHYNLGNAQRAGGAFGKAAQSYKDALALDTPGPSMFADAYHGLAATQLAAGDAAASLATARLAMSLDEGLPTQQRSPAPRIAAGQATEALGDSDGAILLFDQALEMSRDSPSRADAHQARGRTLMGLGRLQESLEALDASLLAAPDTAQVHADRGVCLFEMERGKECLEAFDRSLRLQQDPEVAANAEQAAQYFGSK